MQPEHALEPAADKPPKLLDPLIEGPLGVSSTSSRTAFRGTRLAVGAVSRTAVGNHRRGEGLARWRRGCGVGSWTAGAVSVQRLLDAPDPAQK
jgi:hypothetical protein